MFCFSLSKNMFVRWTGS